jgi:hypothetical protein
MERDQSVPDGDSVSVPKGGVPPTGGPILNLAESYTRNQYVLHADTPVVLNSSRHFHRGTMAA